MHIQQLICHPSLYHRHNQQLVSRNIVLVISDKYHQIYDRNESVKIQQLRLPFSK